jgi:asparagine synthase (glutamine-hydrolysing)
MSILFGVRKHRGATTSRQELFSLGAATERYTLDGVSVATQGRIGMGFQPYYTQQRSTLERLPTTDIEGNMLCFDGRIDNFQELASLLGIRGEDHPDSVIFMAAFHRWGDACFSKVIGDWSVALWSAREQAVYLARDHAGARSLFFRDSAGVLQWSTCLDNLIADGAAPYLD